jgi:hypothetical protein
MVSKKKNSKHCPFLKNFIRNFSKFVEKKIDYDSGISIKLGKESVAVGNDSKLLSKIYETYMISLLRDYCEKNGISYDENSIQNRYPDFIIYNCKKPIAVDIKTSYLKSKNTIHGFTLGTYKGYFRDKNARKNTVYPYSKYDSHICICVVYDKKDVKIRHVFIKEKWRIASRTPGSGNTCNIGSIKHISDIVNDKSIFSDKHEFENFWTSK